jgi:hypothetical protein
MRRAPAFVLVALFSFSLLSPAVFAPDPYAKLPACCRRAGKHRCETPAMLLTPSSGPALGAATCPLFPQAKIGPSGLASGIADVPQQTAPLLVRHHAPEARADSLCRSSYSRAGQKRGPPLTTA